jgi:hypothetical protein
MRGLSTAVIVAAVALVGLLAAVDALRSDQPEARPSAPPTTTTRERSSFLVETLRDELVFGRVIYSDELCRFHSLVLPQMTDQVMSEAPSCDFSSVDGRIVAEDEALSPDWSSVARCRGGEIVVRDADTREVRRRIEGCAPAWRPPGGSRLTWTRGEAVYERGRPLLTRSDVRALARRHPNIADLHAPFRVRITDLAWMDLDNLVVSLAIRSRFLPREYVAVLLEGKTVVAQATTFQDRLGRWFASSAGSFVAAEEGTILTADGDTVQRPDGLPAGRAVAFSPDERWLAYVTGRSVYLVGTPGNNEPGRILQLPIAAQDLVWERLTTTPTFPPEIQ